jgi:hypothetical protein
MFIYMFLVSFHDLPHVMTSHPLWQTRDVIVPQRFHAQLIGPQGATIKSITELFPSININMPRGDSEIVV